MSDNVSASTQQLSLPKYKPWTPKVISKAALANMAFTIADDYTAELARMQQQLGDALCDMRQRILSPGELDADLARGVALKMQDSMEKLVADFGHDMDILEAELEARVIHEKKAREAREEKNKPAVPPTGVQLNAIQDGATQLDADQAGAVEANVVPANVVPANAVQVNVVQDPADDDSTPLFGAPHIPYVVATAALIILCKGAITLLMVWPERFDLALPFLVFAFVALVAVITAFSWEMADELIEWYRLDEPWGVAGGC